MFEWKWFILGWLGHSVTAHATERIRAHYEWKQFVSEVQREGKRLTDQIKGARDAQERF